MRDYSLDLVICFDEERVYGHSDGVSHFIHEYSGVLGLIDDNCDVEETIGSFDAFVVDVLGGLREKHSLYGLLDVHSSVVDYSELYELEDVVFRSNVLTVARSFELVWNPNLLILDRLLVSPAHRGHGVGLLALRTLINRLGVGAGLVALKPFPLQCEARHKDDPEECARLGLDQFKVAKSKATSKLRRYYGRLGFKGIPRSDLMVRNLEDQLPSVEAILARGAPHLET